MILLDADVLLVDHRYPQDPKHVRNRKALDRLKQDAHEVGITVQALLEVVGVLSFTTPLADIPNLSDMKTRQYGLRVIPDPLTDPNYAGVMFAEVVTQIATRMSLGDAVQAVQIARFAPHADALLTWNAKHFRGKSIVPVLTPDEWLQQQPPTAPAAPTP